MDLLFNNTTTPSPASLTSSLDDTYNSSYFLYWASVCTNMYLSLDIIDILVAVVGFPSNVRVLLVLIRGEVNPSTSDLFTGSLALIDCSFSLALALNTLNARLFHNYYISVILYFLFSICEVGAPVFVCCICLDRYAAVIHPITFTRYRPPRYRRILVAVMWCVLLGYSLFRAIANFEHNDELFTSLFILAFTVIIYCNVALLLALQRSGPGDSQSGKGSGQQNALKRRAFDMVLGIFMVALFTFLPTAALYPFKHLIPGNPFQCLINPLCYTCQDIRVVLQPLLFLYRTRKLPCMTARGTGEGEKEKERETERVSE